MSSCLLYTLCIKGGNEAALYLLICYIKVPFKARDRCGRDRMVVGFMTTYAVSTYHN